VRKSIVAALLLIGCARPETKRAPNTTTDLRCNKTKVTVAVLETTSPAGVALFTLPDRFVLAMPRLDCAGAIRELPRASGGTRVDEARLAELDKALAGGISRKLQIAGREATQVTLPERLFVFWPRDPSTAGPGGGTLSSGPPIGPEPELERFRAGVAAQPSVCAPCDPGNPNQPDCDTTPPTRPPPPGSGRFMLESCTPEQCAELEPIYCPVTDAGTRTPVGDSSSCECASICCSQ
jgi:hypothetical protein